MSPLAYPFVSTLLLQDRRSRLLFVAAAPLTLWLTWSAP